MGSKKRPQYSFITCHRQNDLINAISQSICSKISIAIKFAKFFSISIDTTFDISHKEQISFIFRYVDEHTLKINERLLSLWVTSKTTGKNLYDIFKEVCNIHGLDWTNYLVGQAYDGASNMRGQYNGLQSLIIKENPQAIFIWCCSHRLNLVVADCTSICVNAMDLFGNLERLISFQVARAVLHYMKKN